MTRSPSRDATSHGPYPERRKFMRRMAGVCLGMTGGLALVDSQSAYGDPPMAGRPLKFNKRLRLEGTAPDFAGVEHSHGGRVGLSDFARDKLLVLVFTSLRCPMSKKYLERFEEFAREYAARSVRLLATSVETAAMESMGKIRERLRDRPVPYEWLHDGTQQIGRDYGAYVTPQVVILDEGRRVVYAGAWDDHVNRAEVVKHYVLDAVEATLAGRPVLVGESLPKGCDIEYRAEPASRSAAGDAK
jgi:peroxiredoxin